MIFKIGDYIEFDMGNNGYKVGNITGIIGEDIIIHQTEEIYKGEIYKTDITRLRNLKYDLACGYIR